MNPATDLIAPELVALAQDFRAQIGTDDADQWPQLLPLVLPLTVRDMANLSVARIEAWYRARGAAPAMPCRDRRLRGCLVAQHEGGIIFLDAADAPGERRFTLSHEIAHFLLDYRAPRERALARFGPSIRPVLDGLRAPTTQEKLDGILSGVPLGVHRHLMEREAKVSHALVGRIENRADALGLELLAPAAVVCAQLNQSCGALAYFECVAAARALLAGEFGLPTDVSALYAARLARALTGGPSVLSSLGLS